MNKAHAKWVYALPSYKATSIKKRMPELLVALPDPAAAAPDTGVDPTAVTPPDSAPAVDQDHSGHDH